METLDPLYIDCFLGDIILTSDLPSMISIICNDLQVVSTPEYDFCILTYVINRINRFSWPLSQRFVPINFRFVWTWKK